MSNEPDVTFSGKTGGMQPPGVYCYPPGTGGSTDENPVCVHVPYPFVPGRSPIVNNPGELNPDK